MFINYVLYYHSIIYIMSHGSCSRLPYFLCWEPFESSPKLFFSLVEFVPKLFKLEDCRSLSDSFLDLWAGVEESGIKKGEFKERRFFCGGEVTHFLILAIYLFKLFIICFNLQISSSWFSTFWYKRVLSSLQFDHYFCFFMLLNSGEFCKWIFYSWSYNSKFVIIFIGDEKFTDEFVMLLVCFLPFKVNYKFYCPISSVTFELVLISNYL